MIDARILPLQKAALQPVAERLAHRGVKADQIVRMVRAGESFVPPPAVALAHSLLRAWLAA